MAVAITTLVLPGSWWGWECSGNRTASASLHTNYSQLSGRMPQSGGGQLLKARGPETRKLVVSKTPALSNWQRFLPLCACQSTVLKRRKPTGQYSQLVPIWSSRHKLLSTCTWTLSQRTLYDVMSCNGRTAPPAGFIIMPILQRS